MSDARPTARVNAPSRSPGRRGFTLTELVALVGAGVVLGASAMGMRSAMTPEDDQLECAMNERDVAAGLLALTADRQGMLPPGYEFSGGSGTYKHWSGTLLQEGYVASAAQFRCVATPRGGAPNANPGPNGEDWEDGQVNAQGENAPDATPNDTQAKRLAFTANAALIPNAVTASGTPRRFQFVPLSPSRFNRPPTGQRTGLAGPVDPQNTILLAEWLVLPKAQNWRALAEDTGAGGDFYRSHRSVTPFLGVSSGKNVLSEPNPARSPANEGQARFRYPTSNEVLASNQLQAGLLTDASTSEVNAVGRHHPMGSANFAFCDGSVRPLTVQQSVSQRLWGERFHSITGNNGVQKVMAGRVK